MVRLTVDAEGVEALGEVGAGPAVLLVAAAAVRVEVGVGTGNFSPGGRKNSATACGAYATIAATGDS